MVTKKASGPKSETKKRVKKLAEFVVDPIQELRQALEDYAKAAEFLRLSPQDRAQTPVPDVNWQELLMYVNDILPLVEDPKALYPEVDVFEEAEHMPPQKLLFLLEQKAIRCGEQPLFIRVRSLCNLIGFLVYLGRVLERDPRRFGGVTLAQTSHELAFVVGSVYQHVVRRSLPDVIAKNIEGLAQDALPDVLTIISQVAREGNMVAQVGGPLEPKTKTPGRGRPKKA